MPITEDFSIFFDTDGHGVEFTYTPQVGSSITAIGIFDDAFFAAEGGEVSVNGSQPQLLYETKKIPEKPVYGEKITVNDADYTIVGIRPDGTGTTTLILEVMEDGTC